MNEKILIIEDNADIREGVRILLEGEGYAVSEAEDGNSGLAMLTGAAKTLQNAATSPNAATAPNAKAGPHTEATPNASVDLVILDIMLPDISGLKVCEEIRKFSVVPILFLTAKSMESDKLIGLMAGGDDYLTKPFSFAELLGRVKALLRRYKVYDSGSLTADKDDSNYEERNSYITIAGIRINTLKNEVFLDDHEVDLTEREYRILRLLMKYPGKIFSAQNLYESIWEEPYFYNCNGTVLVHIRKLRVKIEKDPHNPQYIKTVWGKGYRFG